jgi:hypothetical protein
MFDVILKLAGNMKVGRKDICNNNSLLIRRIGNDPRYSEIAREISEYNAARLTDILEK